MFGRKEEIAALHARISNLQAQIDTANARTTALRVRVGEDALADLKRFNALREEIAGLQNKQEAPQQIVAVDCASGPDTTTGIVAVREPDGTLRIAAEFQVIHDEIIFDLRSFGWDADAADRYIREYIKCR